MQNDLNELSRFGMLIGIAFQIQDDLLNLVGSVEKYGKEIAGDLYEGKRTIMLNHVIKQAGANGKKIIKILNKKREDKTAADIDFIMDEMHKHGSIEYGKKLSAELALKAKNMLDTIGIFKKETPIQPGEVWDEPMVDRRFIEELVNYVIERDL
jgi:geranylgeranyl diphosphate synthase type II